MSKTVEELLLPRYKVVSPWPCMELEPFHVGQIVTLQKHPTDEGEGFIHIPIKHIPDSYMRQAFFENYPHLFNKLEWWLHRDPKEMPEYIKWPDTGMVAKVTRYQVDDNASWGVFFLDDDFSYHLMHAMPATEEEYNNYKAKKDGKVNR